MFGLHRSATDGNREAIASTDWAPSCNICETPTAYEIRAELPGVEKEDVRITLDNGVLTIQGERHDRKESNDARVHRRELMHGHFMRQFTMPDDADEEKIDAVFKDGMLDVSIAKTKGKTAKSKEIAVH
jgi:HSP20 family protein